MNYRSTNTTNASHRDKGERNRLWLSVLLLLVLTLGTIFVQSSATFAQQEGVWSGIVTDESGNPLPALVTINGVAVQTGDDGRFELKAPAGENDRQIINATLISYATISRIHIGSPLQEMRLAMKKMQRFDIQPDQPIEVEDERGTRISIPAGGLIRQADGSPAKEPLTLDLHTYDLRNEQMVGDMTAINAAGEIGVLKTYGMFEAEFRNEKGELYNLAPGVLAHISVPVPNGKDLPAGMPLWYYSPETGRWIEDGKATRDGERYSGEVSHFTSWNFDLQYIDPDLGDAPDSTNSFGMFMTTYPSAVTARFPTIFNDPVDPGPYHDRTPAVVWLGLSVTVEDEAEPPAFDADPGNNIDPRIPFDNRDQADDGIHLPLPLPPCGYATLNYDVNTPSAVSGDLFFNVWFDFNRDGDWEDTLTCLDPAGNTIRVPEWAVQDEFVSTPAGITTLTTRAFAAMNPATPWDPMWMRATLTTQRAHPSPFTGIPAGGGPATGYLYGETEDYYLTTTNLLLPTPTPTPILPTPTPTRLLPTPTPRPPLYCYNWDFFNRTGQTANDFHLTLQGPKEINIFYRPNPFGNPVKQGLTASGLYEIHYEGADVHDGSLIHLGFCSNSPVANLVGSDQLPPYYWTYNGQPLQKQRIPAVGFHWSFNHVLQPVLALTNATAQEIRIHRVDWAISESAIPLDELNWEPLDGILAWQPLDQETSLPPSEGGDHIASLHYEIPVESVVGDSRSIVYRVWAYEPGNPDNLIKGVGQLSMSQ